MKNQISFKGMVTWSLCTLFFTYEFLLRTTLGTFQSQLMSDLHLTTVQFSLLSSTVFQLVYGLMQIPIGVIIDRVGLKMTLLTAAFLCTIANLGFSFSHDFLCAIFFRVFMGLGASCGFICLLISIYDWMPRKNTALFIGLSQFIGTLGPMLAAGPLSSLSDVSGIGWRQVFFQLSLVGAALSVLVFFYVENNRHQHNKFIFLTHSLSIFTQLLSLIKQKQIWFIAVYSACVYFSIEYLTENEGIAFLVKKGCSSTFSSYMMTTAWIGYALSCPFIGYFSDKIQRRKPFLVVTSLVTLLALTFIIYLPITNELLAISFALLGLGAGGSIIGYSIMAEQCTESSLAAGLGLNNTMIVIASALNAPLIGYLLSQVKTSHHVQLSNYQNAFMMMIVLAFSAAFIAIFCIKETFCKSACQNTILNPTKATFEVLGTPLT